ncbi:PREDICTED: regenerating islet-derived protein 3-gamma-like isoform X2 [Elephantulus edwardii]|uniref:regenerating islet-derived protein 3-gamma-like isoform X2 n=1 Tax=Elephantulus edwardii TaxID=28737 RepID=UPI0003F079EE|nr:PREDICTED: regenerating islet-derived protein 3-gamma-like isoform X2 [Elephantulus edwardii]
MLPSMALPSMSWMLLSCLMLLSQIQAKDAQMEQLSASISCPGGSKAYGSYCYAFFLTPKAWMEANGLELNGGGWEWRNTGVLYYFAWKKDPSTIINHGHCESLSRITGNKKQFFYNCEQRLLYVCEFKN